MIPLALFTGPALPKDVEKTMEKAMKKAQMGTNRGPIGEKTEKLDFRPKTNILLHMAIQAVLA